MAQFRYIVTDVDESISFYVSMLGFELKQQFGPAMAILTKDDLSLWLAGPKSSAAKAMPDGSSPAPGGWARFVLTVDDLDGTIATLKAGSCKFKNEIVHGPGGKQILCEDPSGNIVELFQPIS